MKRRFIILLLILLMILCFSLISIQVIKNTTRATQTVGISITVISAPSLTLISPKNHTYLNNITIPLIYSTDGGTINYSLDSGDNITITSLIYFNVSEGAHTLYLYARNDYGITIRSVNFSVDSTLFRIIHEEIKGVNKGTSTNFTILSYQEIQNLSNITLEHSSYGKINFMNQSINITNDNDLIDNLVNLDTNTNISFNRIELNSTALPNFKKPATLWLYGLTFSEPRILIDGEACPSAICKKESYIGQVLKFNVTSFLNTIYSADETPTTTTTTVIVSGGGGGGGYGTRLPEKGFVLNTEEIKVSVKQGEIITKNFIITNQDNKNINIKIEELKIEDLVLIQEQNFSLNPYQSKIISFDVFARENTLPRLYLGKVFISSETARKELLVGIEVESKKPLFDVKVSIPSRFLYTMPGEELFSEIEIYNLGDIEDEVDVLIEYRLMNFEGKEIYSDSETIAVNTKINFLKSIKIPEDASFGRYVLYIRTTYDDKIGSASAWFNVGKKPTISLNGILIMLSILLFIATIIVLIRIRKIKKFKKTRYKVNKEVLKGVIKN